MMYAQPGLYPISFFKKWGGVGGDIKETHLFNVPAVDHFN